MKQKISTQSFVNSSLEQLFYDRERSLRRFQSAAVELENTETKIAFSSCPYHLGQLVNYRNKTVMCKAIISKVEFIPSEPFYQIWLKKISHKNRKSRHSISRLDFNTNTSVNLFAFSSEFKFTVSEDESISAPKNCASAVNKKFLEYLMKEKIITVNGESTNPLLKEIVESLNRGKSFTELGFKNDLKSMLDYLNTPFKAKPPSSIFRKK
jgi:hypothetical protein